MGYYNIYINLIFYFSKNVTKCVFTNLNKKLFQNFFDQKYLFIYKFHLYVFIMLTINKNNFQSNTKFFFIYNGYKIVNIIL